MTPHGVLEDMTKVEDAFGEKLGDFFVPQLWPNIKALLKHAVSFEYGQSAPGEEHMEFGNQLFDRQLFSLPFQAVFMTASVLPQTAILAVEDEIEGHYGVHMFTFGPTQIGENVRISGVPLLWARMKHDDNTGWIDWKSLTADGTHRSRTTGRPWSYDDFTGAIEKVIAFTLGAATLLMSKEIEATTVPAPDRLNRKREKQGREPIGERRIIRVRPEFRQVQREAAESFRTSPRMHWRRGHFRKLREDFVVPVAPTIVNASEDVKPLAKKYLVNA
jgi:hypothetical protein